MTVLRHPNGALQELGCGARWAAGGGCTPPGMHEGCYALTGVHASSCTQDSWRMMVTRATRAMSASIFEEA